ncbi:MAG: PAS domain S-box protein [Bryobacteraceae bacterium]
MPTNRNEALGTRTAFDRLFLLSRKIILLGVALLILLLVTIEWIINIEYSLGVLYILPMLLGGVVLNRRQVVALALLCAFARGLFTDLPTYLDYILRFAMATLAYCGIGLFVVELRRNRQMYIVHLTQIEKQQALRREAEEQLRVLAESSPAAIMTIDENGNVLAANRATLEMLGLEGSGLIGRSIASYIPVFADALQIDGTHRTFRTAAQCWGRRENGSAFIAHTWFSTYLADGRKRLAAIAVDISEEMRDREEQHLQQLSSNNRILAGAVSHEIRNMCAAVNVVCSNLQRKPGLVGNEDFAALQTLVEGLAQLASFELRTKTRSLTPIQLNELLDRFLIISERSWEEIEGRITVDMPKSIPPVLGDANELLQVLLNLSQNSLRAVTDCPRRELSISLSAKPSSVCLRICDSGPGIEHPELLFHAFQTGAHSTGLGLYVSRARAQFRRRTALSAQSGRRLLYPGTFESTSCRARKQQSWERSDRDLIKLPCPSACS